MEHETRVMNPEEIEREMSNLSPYKHYNSTTAQKLISYHDFEAEHRRNVSWMEGYAVICGALADPPGCGAMTGWGGNNENNWTMNGEEAAIAAWNRTPDRIES